MTAISTVSVIIPILNEADNLPLLFENIICLNPLPMQIILVDGGSIDSSIDVAKALMNTLLTDGDSATEWQIIESIVGRAAQMNAGAALATGNILLFLHADTQLPTNAISEVKHGMIRADSECEYEYDWGRFDVRLDSREPLLWLVSQMINWRSRLSSIATGDQALFIKRSLFEQMGGYPSQTLMEDVELCKRLKKIAKPACLNHEVITSARRWQQHGSWRTIWLMWHLRFDYWRGVSADNIRARYYK